MKWAGRAVLGGLVLMAEALLVQALPPGTPFYELLHRPEKLTIASAPGADSGDTRTLKMFTILGKGAIPAIFDPQFVSAQEADAQMRDDERVLGLSVNGDHRAYSIPLLSRHEIVNDVVGGDAVAVTW